MMMKRLPLILLVFLAGCGCERKPEPQPVPAPTQTETPAPQADADLRTLHVKVVDLNEQALAGIVPVATAQPNAFDAPIASGPKTGPDGASWVRFPKGQALFVRGWDAELKYFANSFVDLAADETPAETKWLMMVPGVDLSAALVLADSQPAAGIEVELMLAHKTWGPWWPSRATTDAAGVADFGRTPPGMFSMRITSAAGSVDVTEVDLRPGSTNRLGPLTLQ